MAVKNYLIVGGSHGIGFGIVKRLQAAGGNVVVISRTTGKLGDLAGITHIQTDVTADKVDPQQLPNEIHGMAYCPGSINLGPVRGVKAETLMADFQLNAIGAVTAVQTALPAMKAVETSSIVFFSTVAVSQGLPMHTSVAASKGAIEGITRTMAAEFAPKIRVNCIAPALTDTPLAERFLSSDDKRAAMAGKYPLKRIGTVDDIASLAEHLLSAEAGWMTGQVIGVDGGMSSLRF